MSKFLSKKSILAIATLAGTIIGVGLFALPYLTLQVGFWMILVYFIILGSLVILVHLFFGELALQTPDQKRLPGFAKIYLGKTGEKIALLSFIFGLFGALLAYLIVGGEFLSELFMPIFGGNSLIYTFIYFIAGTFLIYFGIQSIAKVEFWGLIILFLILIIIFLKGLPLIKITNLFPSPDFSKFFLPYGPILFSLWGAAVIPEIEEMLKENKKMLPQLIFISIILAILIYLFFIIIILGITGQATTPSALTGLNQILGKSIGKLGLLFGLVTTFTSFIMLGLALKKVFCYDLKLNQTLAWLISCFMPLMFFLAGFKNFISVIAMVGGVMLGIDGILILLMYQKIKPRKNFLIYLLTLIFLGGIVYELINFFL